GRRPPAAPQVGVVSCGRLAVAGCLGEGHSGRAQQELGAEHGHRHVCVCRHAVVRLQRLAQAGAEAAGPDPQDPFDPLVGAAGAAGHVPRPQALAPRLSAAPPRLLSVRAPEIGWREGGERVARGWHRVSGGAWVSGRVARDCLGRRGVGSHR
ncbi:hypothetical protein T484DRAFT_2017028, partial [Baffinella frigidus]